MAYNYTCIRFIQRKNGGSWSNFFKAFKWIKPENFKS